MRIVEVEAALDLAPFSRWLAARGIRHRVFLDGGQQVLELPGAAGAAEVRAAFDAWRRGELPLPEDTAVPVPERPPFWRQTPPAVATLLIVTGIVYLLLTLGNPYRVLEWLAFDRVTAAGTVPAPLGQVWRWVTPVFLHFSVVHVLFNAVVVWELGRRVEYRLGAARFMLLVVMLALVSNWAQHLWSSGGLFGGLSGVAYGLLGFILVAWRRVPEPLWHLPQGFAVALLGFLVLFSTGITEVFGLHIANAAHWGGLLTGAFAAAVWPLSRNA